MRCDWIDAGGAGTDCSECELEGWEIVSRIGTGCFAIGQSETELGLVWEEFSKQIIGFGEIVEDHRGCPCREGAVGESCPDQGTIANFMTSSLGGSPGRVVIEERRRLGVERCLEIPFGEVGQRGFDMAELGAVVSEGNDSALGDHDNDPTVRDFGSICKENVFGWSGTILLRMATLFSKIINREIPAEIVFENEYVVAFRDIQPQAPVHILIVPRTEISGLAELPESGDHQHLLNAAKVIAEQEGLGGGYRVVINQGADAGQTVFHLHAHLLGGAPLGGFGVPGLDH